MTRLRLLAVALALLAAPAAAQTGQAATDRTDAPIDPRIRVIDYDPDAVHRIVGAPRTATQVVFAPDETLRHVAVGDSAGWEIAAEGSVLFLKPGERRSTTNLLAVTDRGGQVRHYVFELVVGDTGGRAPAYQIRFRYPDDDQARLRAAVEAATVAAETRLVGLALQRAALEGPRNLAYSVQGASDLQPSEVSDNGRFTVLRFPGAQTIPAIFAVAEDGAERLIPFDVRHDSVVIHGVERGLRLRRGRQVLCIYNEAFDPRGAAAETATASAQIDRLPAGEAP